MIGGARVVERDREEWRRKRNVNRRIARWHESFR